MGAITLDEWKGLGDKILYQEDSVSFEQRHFGTRFAPTLMWIIMLPVMIILFYLAFGRGMPPAFLVFLYLGVAVLVLLRLVPQTQRAIKDYRTESPAFVSEKGFSTGLGTRPFYLFSDMYHVEESRSTGDTPVTGVTMKDGTLVSFAGDPMVKNVTVTFQKGVYGVLRDNLLVRFGKGPRKEQSWDPEAERFVLDNSRVAGPVFLVIEKLGRKYLVDRIDRKFIEKHLNEIGSEAGPTAGTFVQNAREKLHVP